MLSKKGSIPVTLLVILAVALLVFALFLFAMTSFKIKDSLGDSFKKVQEYNLKSLDSQFNGNTEPVIIRGTHKQFRIFGKDVLDISVTKASLGG